jgi:hypothetical protein
MSQQLFFHVHQKSHRRRAIAVSHLSYQYFLQPGGSKGTEVWYKVLHTCCGSALTPAALVAPGSRRHVRLSSTRPSSSNSTTGGSIHPQFGPLLRNASAGSLFSFSLLFSPSFYSHLFNSLQAGAEPIFLFCKSSCHQDMQPQFHIP